ncbi:MAG TPA: penicillin-binding transpeptidase domain-containing protein [Verrucomicrobiae bacterium]|nr:penicillin-binding transpeptidase domain-containing protein [Verrucomicrobiae bacterium]
MIFFDQLKKNEPELRIMAVVILLGLGVLACGLWWVQIVSARDYEAHLEMQSYRTVRIPAVRGKILDRHGEALAENRPVYNLDLHLDDLRKAFDTAGKAAVAERRKVLRAQAEARRKQLGRDLTKEERKQFYLSTALYDSLRAEARYSVASNVVFQIGRSLGQPLVLNQSAFEKHYRQSLAMPLTVLADLNPGQIARFEEQNAIPSGAEIEMQSVRVYPHGSTAAHIIGSVHRDDSSAEGEDAYFSYRLPDYRGQVGIEAGYDKELRGKAGVKSVVINSMGYSQTENVWEPAEAGDDVVLTIDLPLQQKAERALQSLNGQATRGAVVVMEAQTGDILAMASSPTFDPNVYVQGLTQAEWQRIMQLKAEKNRATQENYAPGSIFKTVVGLACLEAGLDPNKIMENTGYIYVGKRRIKDLAVPGAYDFRKALMESSNTYFISNGLSVAGIENIIRLGERLHLGERAGLRTRQETSGIFPSLKKVESEGWHDGDTANICIGQGQMAVTPLQMAVMTSAIANGGRVFWPRLVAKIQPPSPASPEPATMFATARQRDTLGVSARSLQIVKDAMRADVEEGGSGRQAAVPGLTICGKTGTAQVMDERNHVIGENTWFASFAPYENPKYAVVVMVEVGINGGSGGGTCGPVAARIYKALQERDSAPETARPAVAIK